MPSVDKLTFIRNHLLQCSFNIEANGEPLGTASPATLGVVFDEKMLKEFLERKRKQLDELRALQRQGMTDIKASEFLDPFEQVLAHEAFHIYQFLSCSIISDYAASVRRKLRVEIKLLAEVSAFEGFPLEVGELFMAPQADKDVQEYLERVEEDAFDAIQKIDFKASESDFSILEIVEAGAVAFQLISQNDYLGVKIDVQEAVYTRVWDRFAAIIQIDQTNSNSVLVGRMMLMFTCDVYLKFAHNDFQDSRDIFDALELVAPLFKNFPSYVEEFEGDQRQRDKLLLRALNHVEEDQDIVDKVLEYCGDLPSQDQLKFYVNIRLYGDVFKRVALAGAQKRRRPQNNKNRAVNRRLKTLYPFWGSDLTIPCVLSSFDQCSKFSTIWMNIDDVTFIDEIERTQQSVKDDNQVLDFTTRFTNFLSNPNMGAFCCREHGHMDNHISIGRCGKSDSLNQFCVTNFGRSLGEMVKL